MNTLNDLLVAPCVALHRGDKRFVSNGEDRRIKVEVVEHYTLNPNVER